MKGFGFYISVLTIALLTGGCFEQIPEPQTVAIEHGEAIWQTDFNAAQKQAAAENKHVLVDFSGSDWCGWCIKLHKEVFSKEDFISYADENLVLVSVDFPNSTPQSAEQKAANKALAERYGIRGFPTVLILNPPGEVVKRTGYQQGGPGPYVEMIKNAIAN